MNNKRKIIIMFSVFLSLFILLEPIFIDSKTLHNNSNSFSNKERSWFYKPNKDGKPSEEPAEVLRAIQDKDTFYLGDTTKKEIYLTFDEGYENGYTSEILDVLKKHNAPAAFFVVEPYIRECPEIIKRMVDEGHIVANHTSGHKNMAKIEDSEKFKEEIDKCSIAYTEVTGKEMPRFFRPPEGKYSEKSLSMTKDLGFKTIFWSVAYADWKPKEQPNPNYALKTLKERTHNGAIYLLHAVSSTNAEILDELISFWESEGFVLKSLDNLK